MKTVAISHMYNHLRLYVHWMHLLNTMICRYTYITHTVIYCDQDRCVMKLFNLEMDSTVFKSSVFLNYILSNNANFLDSRAQKFPLIF